MPFPRLARSRHVPFRTDDIVPTVLPEWQLLSLTERERLVDVVRFLLSEKRWEAARGFTLTDDVTITIAAHAALMILGLDTEHYRNVRSIIVHARTLTMRGPHRGPVTGVFSDEPRHLAGEAHDDHGPVLLAWDAARRDARHPGTGRNVIVHEFAHKLDMLDGLIDGTPLLPDRASHDRWVTVCTNAYDALRNGEPEVSAILRSYGAQDPGEFFAVATESFFDRPGTMRQVMPELYGVFTEYYNQDPASRRPAVAT